MAKQVALADQVIKEIIAEEKEEPVLTFKIALKDSAGNLFDPNVVVNREMGAPFDVGERVKVISPADEFAKKIGWVGVVSNFIYSSGCGETYPGDPMISVVFKDGSNEVYWKEELTLLPPEKGL